jgi:hypothetical protein
MRRRGRPRWWAQLILVAAFYHLYDATRNLRPDTRTIALQHGHTVRQWWIDAAGHATSTLNHWVAGIGWIEGFAAYYYVVAHVLVTGLVLAALFAWRPDIYLRHRNALFVASGIAFVVYWLYPVAPPRLLPGYVDSVAVLNPFHVGSVEVTSANIYAAMPSLHVAWAVWAAVAVGAMLRRWWQRALVALHPLVTVFVVLATANHFLADAVAGSALIGASYLLLLLPRPLRLPALGGALGRRVRPSELLHGGIAQQQPLHADIAAEVDAGLGAFGDTVRRHHGAQAERIVRHPVPRAQREHSSQTGTGTATS